MAFSFESKWLTFLFCCIVLSCSSSRTIIQNARAFVMTPMQGMARIDEKGNEVRPAELPVVVVYVESKSDQLKWDSAWIGGKGCNVQQQLITQKLEIGFDAATGENIIITPRSGYYLYQLQVIATESQAEAMSQSIRLRAGLKNKTFENEVSPIISIRLHDAQ